MMFYGKAESQINMCQECWDEVFRIKATAAASKHFITKIDPDSQLVQMKQNYLSATMSYMPGNVQGFLKKQIESSGITMSYTERVKRFFMLDHKKRRMRIFYTNDAKSQHKLYKYEEIMQVDMQSPPRDLESSNEDQ